MALHLPSLSPVAWVAVEKVTQQVLWLILFAVLAPILGPRPYGLFSIVMVFVGLCESILLEGAIEALVTVDDLDHLHTSTANLASAGVSIALATGISVMAPAVSGLFQDEDIKYLMWALAPLPLLTSLSATPIAIMRRSMDYRLLAIRSILGLLIGGTFGIALALAGYGVWALAMQALAQRVAEFSIAWISAPIRLRFAWSGLHFRALSPVGANVFAGRVMSFAGGQLPRIIIGYVLGPTALGLFTLATRFQEIAIQTAVQPLTTVARIALRDARPGSSEFEDIFAKVTQNVSLLCFPILLGGAVVVPEIFRLWLDERWIDGIVPMQLILLSGVPMALFYCIDSAFFAANQSRLFAWTSAAQTVTILLAVICTAPFGLNATCLSLAIRPWITLPIMLLILHRSTGLPIFKTMYPSILALIGAIIMSSMLELPYLHLPSHSQIKALVFIVSMGVLIYFSFLYLFLRGHLKTLLGSIFLSRP